MVEPLWALTGEVQDAFRRGLAFLAGGWRGADQLVGQGVGVVGEVKAGNVGQCGAGAGKEQVEVGCGDDDVHPGPSDGGVGHERGDQQAAGGCERTRPGQGQVAGREPGGRGGSLRGGVAYRGAGGTGGGDGARRGRQDRRAGGGVAGVVGLAPAEPEQVGHRGYLCGGVWR
jgi:hypothetical protein